ncbi:STAS domain-containing protein [Glaciecola petra]|uniref:STAS domain-containing protein n=1 Tax=Glaciecola petra TaxID=3075602 RepID=A0ABU2ZWN5_9ALTE|nr:STAS domain-containing protein [Aestuariibacter sp. P117]MDT0595984.1 STAS domain-containing protein [Aestuariibacter sp. P117]
MKLSLNKDADESNTFKLSISGELDRESLIHDYWTTVSALDKKALQSAIQLTIDLQETKRADTAGLAWLLNLKRDLLKHIKTVTIINVPQKLLNLADLSGAQSLLKE